MTRINVFWARNVKAVVTNLFLAMFFNAFAIISGVPVKASNLLPINHYRTSSIVYIEVKC